MSYLTLFDAVTADNLPAGAVHVCFYTDGTYANEAAVKARCPHATYLSITVKGGVADCCDCEQGDLTPAQAEAWVQARLKEGAFRPVVYASQDTWENQGLLKGLAAYGSKIRRWVAAYPGTGANVPSGYDAHQFSDGNYDTSVCLSNFFDGPPKPLPIVRNASVEVQVSVPEGTTGKLNVLLTYDAARGDWTHHEVPGLPHWSGPGGGAWRTRPLDWDAPPLGK